MGVLTNRLFADDISRRLFSDDAGPLGPGQSTIESMTSGLQAGPMGRSFSAGPGQEVIGQQAVGDDGLIEPVMVDGNGLAPGEVDWVGLGQALGIDPDTAARMAQTGFVQYTPSVAGGPLSGQSLGRDRTAALTEQIKTPAERGYFVSGRDGGGSVEGTGRDAGSGFHVSSRDMGVSDFSAGDFRRQVDRDRQIDQAQENFFGHVSRGKPEEIMFNNLMSLTPEQLAQVDFSDQGQLQNLSSISLFNTTGDRDRLEVIKDDPDKTGSLLGDIIKVGVPGLVKAGIGAINPIAGFIGGTFMDTTAGGQSFQDALKQNAMGLGLSVAGGAITGGLGALDAGGSITEGALGGVGDTLTSANLTGAGDTLLGGTATQPSIEDLGGPFIDEQAALDAGQGGKFALEELITGGDIPGVTDPFGNLMDQFNRAPTGKDFAKNFADPVITTLNSLAGSRQGDVSGGGEGVFLGNQGAFENIFGIKETGMGFLDPLSDQQIAGIGVR